MSKIIGSLLLLIFGILPQNAITQSSQFEGEWTKIGTTYVFEFFLHLNHSGKKVEGYFEWKVLRFNEGEHSSESYYQDKIGLSGKEYVRGYYDSKEKEYRLRGYKKEDPHLIIGLDSYRLKVDENGDIGGDSKTGGSWNGRINGKAKRDIVMTFPSSPTVAFIRCKPCYKKENRNNLYQLDWLF